MKPSFYQDIIDMLVSIFVEQAYLNVTLSNYLNTHHLNDHENRLFTRIVYGVTEKQITLDYLTQPLTKGKRLKPYLRNALRIAIYDIEEMSLANHYIVNEIVEAVKQKDYKGSAFLNAILRTYLRDETGKHQKEELTKQPYLNRLVYKYSMPMDIVSLLNKEYPNDLEMILEELCEGTHLNNCYRLNYLKASKETIREILDKDMIQYQLNDDYLITPTSLINTSLYKNGYLTPQDASSIKVGKITNPPKGSKVLDCCSAPGGKSMHMAMLMENKGRIIAGDIYEHKLKLIENNAKLLGVTIVEPTLMDATKTTFNELFDYVLADVPCSGLGVIAHKPDLKYRMNINKINEINELQKAIINHIYRFVKPMGYLVYSTCTINKDENEGVIAAFLKKHLDFSIIEEEKIIPQKDSHCDGFYICKMQRKEN